MTASVVYPAQAPLPEGQVINCKNAPLWLLTVAGPFCFVRNHREQYSEGALAARLDLTVSSLSRMLLLPCCASINRSAGGMVELWVLVTGEEKALVAGEVYAGLVRNRKGRR